MKKVQIIQNPSSGRQQNERKLEKIANILLNEGFLVAKFNTAGKDDAKRETIRAVEEGFDVIIASGGDGTINEVAQGMRATGKKVPVAILPTGTTNDFATYLKLPDTPKEFCEMILRGKTVDADLGLYNDRVFVNVAAAGLFSSVAHEVEKEKKMILGKLAYILEGMKEFTLSRSDVHRLNFYADGEEHTEEAMLFIISNSSSVGGFRYVSPKAEIMDGLLDIVIIKEAEIHEMAEIFFALFQGGHVSHPKVLYFKSDHIVISSDKPMVVDIDGEYGGTLPAEFSVVPGAFRVLI